MKPLNVCESIMELLRTWGFTEQVPKKELEKAIMWVRQAVDERALKRWTNALETFGYIQRANKNIFRVTTQGYVSTLSLSQNSKNGGA
jgi:hypothetical protein